MRGTLSDGKLDETRRTPPSLWARKGYVALVMFLSLWPMVWAVKQLGWLFGWTREPRQDHSGQILDAMFILAAGIFLMVHAMRHVQRNEAARQAMLDQFHEKAESARKARDLHA